MVDEYRDRLAEAMKDAKVSTAALAAGLKITYQAVRKVLAGGRFGAENNAKAAKLLNVSSDWLATGKGQKAPAVTVAPPTGAKKGDFVEAVTPEEMELIRHFRHLLPSDRKAALSDMQKLGDERASQRREMLEEAGLTDIMERAKNAVRSTRSSASMDPDDPQLRQRSLLDDNDK